MTEAKAEELVAGHIGMEGAADGATLDGHLTWLIKFGHPLSLSRTSPHLAPRRLHGGDGALPFLERTGRRRQREAPSNSSPRRGLLRRRLGLPCPVRRVGSHSRTGSTLRRAAFHSSLSSYRCRSGRLSHHRVPPTLAAPVVVGAGVRSHPSPSLLYHTASSEHSKVSIVHWTGTLVSLKPKPTSSPTLAMDTLEVKNDEEYQMDLIEIKDSEEHPVEMLVEQPRFLEPICPEEVNEDTRIYPRIGDEYQVEVPNLATEEERMKLRSCPVDDSRMFGFDHPVGVGLAIPVTCTQNTSNHVKKEQMGFSECSSCSLQDECNSHIIEKITRNVLDCKVECDEQDDKFLKSAGQDMHGLQKRNANDYIPLLGMPRYLWTDEEAQAFLLGLYIFGKNLVQVTKFMECKTMGEVLSYYYGEFFRSDAYKRWAACRKVRSRRCILGLRIFSGSRQQELLSRILAGIAREVHDPLLEVFKMFNDGISTFEQFILSLRSTVGAQVLVEAVGIGKGKYDLTGFALDPSRNHGISNRAEIPIGKACSLLSSGDIIKFLTGDFRLSKAKSNDLFWEAVWPRLLARGWHSEQPKDSSLVGKHALVFLIPGVKKFSRKKLVKGNHYFDSVSDVLSKVASEPRLLEFGVEGDNGEGGFKVEDGWIHDAELVKSTVPDKKSPCYTRPSEPGCSPELMKFTVVDTSIVQGEEPCKVRSLRNLPIDASRGYMSSRSGDSGSDSSEEHSDSEDSSQSYEHIYTSQDIADDKYVNEEKKCKPPTGDKMDVDVLQKNSAFSVTSTSMNGHISIGQGFSTMNKICSSTATILPVGTQRVHATNSSTEINFQFDQRVSPEPQVFLAPVSKRRRLVSCKNERTGRRNTAINRRQHGKQVDTPLQHNVSGANDASSGAKPFIWSAIPNSSTNISFDMNNTQAYHTQFYNVPHTDEKMVYKEKSQNKHFIDLNIPHMPSDYESAANYIVPPSDKDTQTMDIPIHSSETNEMDDCSPDINVSCNGLLSEQLSFNTRRQSTRSRPPTTRALEALACGFIGTKQKGGEANFPSSSRSSRPIRRPRRLTDVAVPFPFDGEGSSSHFTNPAVIVNEWCMSNTQFQVLDSTPSDKPTDQGTRELFGADKSADKGTHELFGIP